MTDAKEIRTIPLVTTKGFGPELHGHLSETLADLDARSGEPVALARMYPTRGSEIIDTHVISALMVDATGCASQTILPALPRNLRDKVGGAAFTVFGDQDLFETLKTEAIARGASSLMNAYHIAGGVLLCPNAPLKWLRDLRSRSDELLATQISQRILDATFCCVVNERISHHEQITFTHDVHRLMKILIDKNLAYNERGQQAFPDPERRAQFDAVTAALSKTDIRILPLRHT
ncbi:hypothetical protein ACOI1H_21625 [Loktanella sp. DJP18]|uniref:hypothetical protein n=1 Tax=Loktanella sp. DJP18 TaxID=3409788 RepID=UPI003BB4F734